MIRNEDGLLTEYVFVDVADLPIGDYVGEAQHELQTKLKLPPGYSVFWSGQYETALRLRHRLMLIVPITIAIILFFAVLQYSSGGENHDRCPGGSVLRRGLNLDDFRA